MAIFLTYLWGSGIPIDLVHIGSRQKSGGKDRQIINVEREDSKSPLLSIERSLKIAVQSGMQQPIYFK